MNRKWNIIKTFIKTDKHGLLIILALATGLCYNILTILIPISIGKFYELSFGFSSHRLAAFKFIPFMDAPDFEAFIFFFFSLVLLRLLFEYMNRYSISLVGERFSKILREQLFENQLQITMEVYNSKGIGKYLLRYSGDLKSIQNYIKNGLIRFSQDVVLLIIVMIAIGYFDLFLACIVGGCICISSVLLWLINKELYKASLDRRNTRSGMLSFVNTRLRGILALKAFNKYQPEEKRYRKRSDKLYLIGKRYSRIVALLQALIPAITYTMLGGIMWYVFHSSNNPDKTTLEGSSLLVLILLIISILPVLRRTLRVSIVWKLGNISFAKLIDIFDLPKENRLPFEHVKLYDGDITIQNVSFSYPNTSKPIFENLNLVFKAQTTTLLRGTSGSGKSTLVRLLLKFFSPSKGTILYGGLGSCSLSEKTIRKHVTVVSKDFPLYGKNVYEAICYNRKEEKKLEATLLLEKLQQHEDKKTNLHLETPIGDLGCNLTSGQQKILMYCRALLTKKSILIIEEPLQELNVKTQELILGLLNSFHEQKTLILINEECIEGAKIDQIHRL